MLLCVLTKLKNGGWTVSPTGRACHCTGCDFISYFRGLEKLGVLRKELNSMSGMGYVARNTYLCFLK